MKIKIANKAEQFDKETATIFLETAISAIKENGRFTAALSGGSTPKSVFKLLTEPYFKSRVPWEKTYLFWGDERCVPPSHEDSNYRMTHELLISKVPIPEKNIFRMQGEMDPPRDGAKAYESAIRSFFRLTESIPRFDLVWLGMGEDGHTASLFPGSSALTVQQHLVTSNYVEKLSSNRITMTYPLLNNGKKILFAVRGKNKADVIRDIFRDDISDHRYPVQKIKPTNGDLIWLLDSEAASSLMPDIREIAEYI